MNSNFFLLLLAAILALCSWIGIGWAAAKILRVHRIIRPTGPLLAAIGISLTVTIGGITNLFAITSTPLLIAVTIVGMTCALAALVAHFRRRSRNHALLLWLFPPTVLAASMFFSSIASTRLNPGDDQLAYMLFPRQMLQTGTLLAPFNMRRLGTYGGQQFLQAQLLALSETLSPDHGERDFALHGTILDTGLCALISAGLLWSLMRPRSPRQRILASLVVIMFLLVSIPRVNTHAQMSGTLLFLALFRILKTLRHRPAVPLAILAGLIAAALATLRMNFLPAAALAIAFSAWQFRASRPVLRPRMLLPASIALFVMIAALTPWAVVLYRSSGTPLYPLFKGFQQGPFLDSALSLQSHLAWVLSTILFPPILTLLAPLALAPWSHRFRPVLPLYIAAIATTLATAWTYTTVDAWMIYRYSSPLLMACAFAGLAMILSRRSATSPPVFRSALCLLLIIPCILASPFSEAFRAAYPILLVPALALTLCLPKSAPRLLRTISFLLISLLVIHGAIHNFSRMADNSGLFFYFAAISGLCALAYFSSTPLIQRIAAATAALLFIAALIGITRIFGPTLVTSVGLLALAALILVRLTSYPLSPTRAMIATAISLLGLFIAIANLPFILDTFSPWLLAASIAALAFLAWRARSTAMNLAAAFAVAILCLSTSTSSSGISLHPVALPIAWATVAAALLAPRLSPTRWLRWTPAALALGLAFLAIDEARLLATFPSTAAATAEVHFDQERMFYRSAQASIPPAAPIFTVVTDPAFLDFRRNPINESDDEIEFISPPPKIPLTDSPLLLRRYFKTLNIRYLILSDAMLEHGRLPPSFQHALTQLAATRPILFRAGDLTVIDVEN